MKLAISMDLATLLPRPAQKFGLAECLPVTACSAGSSARHKSRSDGCAGNGTSPASKTWSDAGVPHFASLAKYAVAFLDVALLGNVSLLLLQPADLRSLVNCGRVDRLCVLLLHTIEEMRADTQTS